MLDYAGFSARVVDLIELDCDLPVHPYDDLYGDLGVDSFQAFQLIVVVEALADSLVPPPELPELFTMQDAFDYYRRLVGAEV